MYELLHSKREWKGVEKRPVPGPAWHQTDYLAWGREVNRDSPAFKNSSQAAILGNGRVNLKMDYMLVRTVTLLSCYNTGVKSLFHKLCSPGRCVGLVFKHISKETTPRNTAGLSNLGTGLKADCCVSSAHLTHFRN